MPYLHPDRVAGVVGVNTPLTTRTPMPPTQLMRMMVGGKDEKLYILWFQQPGVAEAVLDKEPGLVFEKLLRTGVPMEEVAKRLAADFDMNPFRRLAEMEPMGELIGTPAERAHYTEVFTRTGFRGGINWYRNFDRNWEIGTRHRREADRRAVADGVRRTRSRVATRDGGRHAGALHRSRDRHDQNAAVTGRSRKSPTS